MSLNGSRETGGKDGLSYVGQDDHKENLTNVVLTLSLKKGWMESDGWEGWSVMLGRATIVFSGRLQL